MGYQSALVASARAQGHSLPDADSNLDDQAEGVDNEGDWEFYGAIAEESAQCVGVTRMLQVSSDEYRTM